MLYTYYGPEFRLIDRDIITSIFTVTMIGPSRHTSVKLKAMINMPILP